tara:strand:- start:6539 stop:7267 length:729 start_codon:yes stop_codon:yes gene_type:complete
MAIPYPNLENIIYPYREKNIGESCKWTTSNSSTITMKNDFTDYNYKYKYIIKSSIINYFNNAYSTSSSSYDTWIDWSPKFRVPVDPHRRLRDMIRARQAPRIIVPAHRRPMPVPEDDREVRARETLHRVLGEAKFRQFLAKGFVTVRADSGLVYQIFPDSKMTHVFDQGKHIETLCVVMQGNFPPTDSLIMRFLLILNDESEFRKIAISHSVGRRSTFRVEEHASESLVFAFKQLKAEAKAA